MKKKGWNPQGFDPLEHNELMRDIQQFRRDPGYHERWRQEHKEPDWPKIMYRPLGLKGRK